MQIPLWSQVQLMLSLAASLEGRPILGASFVCWSKPLLFGIQGRKKKKKKKRQAEKKEGINKTADENRGKVLEAAGCGGVGTVWAEPAAGSKEHRRLTAHREVEGKAEHGFLKACLYPWLAFTFAFAKPRSPHSSPSLASPLRRGQSSPTWHFGLWMRPLRIY